jgi:hypothetical protein
VAVCETAHIAVALFLAFVGEGDVAGQASGMVALEFLYSVQSGDDWPFVVGYTCSQRQITIIFRYNNNNNNNNKNTAMRINNKYSS